MNMTDHKFPVMDFASISQGISRFESGGALIAGACGPTHHHFAVLLDTQ